MASRVHWCGATSLQWAASSSLGTLGISCIDHTQCPTWYSPSPVVKAQHWHVIDEKAIHHISVACNITNVSYFLKLLSEP